MDGVCEDFDDEGTSIRKYYYSNGIKGSYLLDTEFITFIFFENNTYEIKLCNKDTHKCRTCICFICRDEDEYGDMICVHDKHFFHLRCLLNWFKHIKQDINISCLCPYCMKPIDWKEVKKIELIKKID